MLLENITQKTNPTKQICIDHSSDMMEADFGIIANETFIFVLYYYCKCFKIIFPKPGWSHIIHFQMWTSCGVYFTNQI